MIAGTNQIKIWECVSLVETTYIQENIVPTDWDLWNDAVDILEAISSEGILSIEFLEGKWPHQKVQEFHDILCQHITHDIYQP